jgi:two-component system OmpR family response regulator
MELRNARLHTIWTGSRRAVARNLRDLTHRVLIVDDDLHIREVIRVALKKAGMTIFEARDGKEALTRFAGDRPDLIVLDIGMPEFDGLDVCREIRKSSDVPILFLSARDDEIDRVLGLEIGGDDYVTKPFSPGSSLRG